VDAFDYAKTLVLGHSQILNGIGDFAVLMSLVAF
jgi:hypothetical protein